MFDYYSNHYVYKVILGYFNINPAKPKMNMFLSIENLSNLIKESTCLNEAGSCINLMLKNSKYCFQYSSSIETGLSDHHHMIFSMMKTKLPLEEPKRLVHRSFQRFNSHYFEEELSSKLDISNKDFTFFGNNFVNVLNKNAPKTAKILTGNHKPHVSKSLRLAITKRFRLRNKANKIQLPSDKQNYKKQTNLVTKLNKQFKKKILIIFKITLGLELFGISVSHNFQISTIP